ncbi:hypothetical protein DPMN_053233 [Dreissena polymorpha]|uniref:Uncharacterized protein n=1 Tax=Dreissena polymorpha TaxID=45954 RepID=A0A9D4HRZ6_DREPO|nr:hypothetical protein DPMN_053233 [Dreissena polymorpha]
MLKLAQTNQQTNQPTDQPTNRQGKNNMFPTTIFAHEHMVRKKALPPGGHMKNAPPPPPPGGHVFQQTRTIFEIIHDIISTIVLTKFHEDLTINMTSRVNKAPYPRGHNKINVLTKFHGDWTKTKTKTAPSPGGNVFPLITTIFKLIRPINKTNVLTKFHDDWPKHVTFRVFTGFFGIYI